ncbi:MAG: glycine cleavage system aminomethyltransferase GcvT [Actinomycetes bacterium]
MTAPLRHSPLQSRHEALGAKMADFGGWLMPIEYPGGGVLKEHAAVRDAVGLFDVSHLGKMRVTGPGASDFVNSVLTNDLRRISPGQAQYSLLCNENGGVVDDLIVYLRGDDEVFLVPNAANTAAVLAVMTAAAPRELTVADEHEDLGVLAVQGPAARDVLHTLGLPSDHDYMAFVDAELDGVPLVVCRTGYTGELGFELLPRWNDTARVWDSLVEAGGAFGLRVSGLGARDTLRTEMGYPLHGQDLSPTVTAVQARLGWAVGWAKPAFGGRDALLAEKESGPSRLLRGIKAGDRGIPRPHMVVTRPSGEVVGEVTSGTFSPTLRCGIGLALLDASVVDGDQVQVDVRGRPSTMAVVQPPFVEPSTR